MALTWDMSDVVKSETTEDNATHYVMCMMTKYVGMPKSTAENAGTFFIRAHMVEAVMGALRQSSEGPVRITLAEVKAFIGLKTNATTKTPAAFRGDIGRYLESAAKDAMRAQLSPADVSA